MELLSKINSPKDLKKLDIDQLSYLSDELSSFIDDVITKHGGHYASPLGVVDLTIALHYIYESPFDKLIWDVGHQAYPHKILTGRRDDFPTIRTKDGISGFLKRSESEHDAFGAGHASTSISAALGFAHARDAKNTNEQVVAIIGDGAMTGGLAYEGINNLGYHRTQMTIVLNDNSMSISKSVGALSKYLNRVVTNPTYNKIRKDIWDLSGKVPMSSIIRKILRKTEGSIKGFLTPGGFFEDLGLRYIGPVDGHNIKEMADVFNSVKSMNTPVLVHVYTNKGKGSKDALGDSEKYYSVSPKKSDKPIISYSDALGQSLNMIADMGLDFKTITAAMEKGTGLKTFIDKYKNRYIDVGIAEEHALTYAAGLAASGINPIVPIYSTFMQRAYDCIFHDILLQDLPVTLCMDRAGLVGADGPTHHGVFDISMLLMLPNIIITAPKDGNELKDLLYTSQIINKPMSIRYPKGSCINFDNSIQPNKLIVGSWEEIIVGEKVAILAVGSMVDLVKKHYDYIISKVGYKPHLVNCRFIKPVDIDMINDLEKKFKYIVTIEEGAIRGGFGMYIKAKFSERFLKIKNLGIPDKFIEHGQRSELLEDIGLSKDGISKVLMGFR